MNKLSVFLGFFLASLPINEVLSQKEYFISIAYSTYTLLNDEANPIGGISETKMPCLQIITAKQIFPCLRMGPYVGGGVIIEGYENLYGTAYGGKISGSLLYGISVNFSLLPMLMEKDDFRFDVYASGRAGGNYVFMGEKDIPKGGNYFDYSLMGGLAFYMTKKIGLYGEYGFGEYSNYRVGITLRY